jgi:ketosteroid isomerase-like protein
MIWQGRVAGARPVGTAETRSDGVPLATRDVDRLLFASPQFEPDRPSAVLVSTWTLRGARAACVITGTSLRTRWAAARMDGPWERGGNSLDGESWTSMARGAGGSDVDEQANVRVVEGMFSALRRGDIPGVLDRLSDDIEWRIAGPSELPYAGIHRGRDEVAKFFETFGQAAEFEVFEPREYLAKADKVVVLGHERQRIKASGQVVETDWAMVFALRSGRITRFRNFVDSRDVTRSSGGS